MAKRLFPLLLIVLVIAVPAWPAHATTASTDFVRARGAATISFEVPALPITFQYRHIVIDAHSDSSGANVGGTISFDFGTSTSTFFSLGGPVTCMAIHANKAVIGFNDTKAGFGPTTVQVTDNGSTGSPPDVFFSDPVPTNCVTNVPSLIEGGNLTSGDIVVHDMTPGNIVGTSFEKCNTLHVVYNRFPNGTIVHWTVTTNGVGTVASGQFSAVGGGPLGSKTYHFLDISLGTTIKPNFQSHVTFTWGVNGTYSASPNPACM